MHARSGKKAADKKVTTKSKRVCSMQFDITQKCSLTFFVSVTQLLGSRGNITTIHLKWYQLINGAWLPAKFLTTMEQQIYYRQAGDNHAMTANPSTHTFLNNVKPGTYFAEVTIQVNSRTATFDKAVLSVIQL